jgi:hypothetical protein
MRPSLLQTFGQPRERRRQHSRRNRKARRGQGFPTAAAALHLVAAPVEHEPAPVIDLAVARARQAGGPIDLACYTCQCGYLFTAPVSTTVSCPHCGTDQAW